MKRRDILMFLCRRRWSLIGTLILVLSTVSALVYVLPPTYGSRALVLVERNRDPTKRDEAVEGLEMAEVMNAEVRIATARTVMAATVDELKPHERPSRNTLIKRTINSVVSKMHEWGLIEVLPARDNWIKVLRKSVTAKPVPDSNIVEITYYDEDPEWAALIVNAVTSNYIEHHLDVYRASAGETEFYRQQLEAAAQQLSDRRAKRAIITGDKDLASIEERRKSLLGELSISRRELATRRGELSDTLMQYGRLHPEVRSKERNLAVLEDEVRRLEREISALDAQQANAHQISLQIELDEKNYFNYKNKFDEAQLSEIASRDLVNLRPIDDGTVAKEPINTRLVPILVSIPAGLLLGFCIAFVREYVDDHVSDPADAELALGLPTFGSIERFGLLARIRG